jgi:hypothetical protein
LRNLSVHVSKNASWTTHLVERSKFAKNKRNFKIKQQIVNFSHAHFSFSLSPSVIIMRHHMATFWFKLTGKYPTSLVKSRSAERITNNNIGGIELKSFGVEVPTSDIDERDLYPHLFQGRGTDGFERFTPKPASNNASASDKNDSARFVGVQPIPEITVGSILTWGLIKTAALVLLTWFVTERFRLYEYWLVGLGMFWFVVAYPAFLQYQRFKEQTQRLEKNSLCATCCHFDETGHFCRLMDEHVSETYIPCEGLSWEGKER